MKNQKSCCNEERDVAEDVYVDERGAAQQPVRRESRHAHRDAQQRGEEDAEQRHLDGVQPRDDQGVEIGVLRAVPDERLADGDARGAVEEGEPEGDVALVYLVGEVEEEEGDEGENDDGGDGLEGEPQDDDVAPDGDALVAEQFSHGVGKYLPPGLVCLP